MKSMKHIHNHPNIADKGKVPTHPLLKLKLSLFKLQPHLEEKETM